MFFTFWYQDVLVLLYTSLYLAKNLKGKGLAYCFLSLERVKITRNWNFHLKTKHVFSLLVTFDVDACSNRKKVNFCVQYFVFWFIQILKLCKSLFYSRFWYKNSVGKCDLTFPNLQKVSPGRFSETSYDSKEHYYRGISISIQLFYSHFSYLT